MTAEEKRALTAKKRSDSLKRYWSNLSSTQRRTRGSMVSAGIAKMSPDQKKKRSENSSKATRIFMNSLSDEEKRQRSKKLSASNIERYRKMSPEERIELGRKISSGQLAIDPVKRKDINRRRSESMKTYIASLSPEEAQARRDRVQEWWNNMTPEQYQEWNRNRSVEYEKYIQSLDNRPNTNEQSVMDKLKECDIKFSFQYRNQIIHPDFHQLFPVNPVTGSRFIDPTHKWDFRISTNEKDLYLDIDGSIHFHLSYSVTHPTTGITFQMLDYHKFNDSQRPYQTDGLDAYVIKCDDDKLTDMTPVENVGSHEVMTSRQFTEILMWMNLPKDVQRELIEDSLRNKTIT